MSSMSTIAFQPADTATVSVAATTTSANVVLTLPDRNQILVTLVGTTTAYVRFGIDNSVVALAPSGSTPGSFPVLGGSQQVFSKAKNHTHVAVIMSSGTGTAFFTAGGGI